MSFNWGNQQVYWPLFSLSPLVRSWKCLHIHRGGHLTCRFPPWWTRNYSDARRSWAVGSEYGRACLFEMRGKRESGLLRQVDQTFARPQRARSVADANSLHCGSSCGWNATSAVLPGHSLIRWPDIRESIEYPNGYVASTCVFVDMLWCLFLEWVPGYACNLKEVITSFPDFI